MSKVNKVAILIDGGFFIQRFKAINKKYPLKNDVEALINDIMIKVTKKSGTNSEDILFRTYYYDSLPFSKTIRNASGKKKIDFSASPIYQQQHSFIYSLATIDQFALRLGELSFSGWKIDVRDPKRIPKPDFRQKGVDMKIGLDMAWMAGRNTINKIVLVAGDSDFVSPMKLVRREGILVYVYPMGNHIKPKFIEHSDFILK